jgi:hypothetical protein
MLHSILNKPILKPVNLGSTNVFASYVKLIEQLKQRDPAKALILYFCLL